MGKKDHVLDMSSSVSQQQIPNTIPPPSSCSSGSFGRCEPSAHFAYLLTHDQTPLAGAVSPWRFSLSVHHLPMPGAEELRTGEHGAVFWGKHPTPEPVLGSWNV